MESRAFRFAIVCCDRFFPCAAGGPRITRDATGGQTPSSRGWRGGAAARPADYVKRYEPWRARSRLYRSRFLQVNALMLILQDLSRSTRSDLRNCVPLQLKKIAKCIQFWKHFRPNFDKNSEKMTGLIQFLNVWQMVEKFRQHFAIFSTKFDKSGHVDCQIFNEFNRLLSTFGKTYQTKDVFEN